MCTDFERDFSLLGLPIRKTLPHQRSNLWIAPSDSLYLHVGLSGSVFMSRSAFHPGSWLGRLHGNCPAHTVPSAGTPTPNHLVSLIPAVLLVTRHHLAWQCQRVSVAPLPHGHHQRSESRLPPPPEADPRLSTATAVKTDMGFPGILPPPMPHLHGSGFCEVGLNRSFGCLADREEIKYDAYTTACRRDLLFLVMVVVCREEAGKEWHCHRPSCPSNNTQIEHCICCPPTCASWPHE
ncbi:hypothetical protein BDZ89DRAFT_497187 [Hymenopellis radicata]|nr:hypothetical protein BDZ89DRAFT_497187 [Hymenopellis radicata]